MINHRLISIIRFVSRFTTHLCKKIINKLHLVLQISKIPSQKKIVFTHPGTKHGLYMRATVGVGRGLIAQLVAGRRQSRRKSGLSSQIILTRQPKTKPCMIIQHNRSPVSHYYEKKYTYHMPRSFGMETSSVTSIGTSGFWVQSSAAHALLLLKFQ